MIDLGLDLESQSCKVGQTGGFLSYKNAAPKSAAILIMPTHRFSLRSSRLPNDVYDQIVALAVFVMNIDVSSTLSSGAKRRRDWT